MRYKKNRMELLTGFLMGSFSGFLIELAILFFCNLISKELRGSVILLKWWMLIPFPILCGWIWARRIASLHLEDYPQLEGFDRTKKHNNEENE